ncbi:polysaccharide deacetylase [Motiliproteus sp. MSK22-1]|nr:polysaccharide deacetylase [Motiliproteus sp. MSK22-1]
MFNKIKFFLLNQVLPDRMLLVKGRSSSRSIYLTFDDGPCPGITPLLLETLQKHDVKGTFFVIGKNAERNPDILLDICNNGHSIGNHSYNHHRFSLQTLEEQKQELQKTNEIVKSITGASCNIFRAPQGRWNLRLLWSNALSKITSAHWSLDSLDYLKEPATLIVQRLREKPVKNGDILLFHDDNKVCIEVLDVLIPVWKSEGFEFKVL